MFTASPTGSPLPTYQWDFNGSPILGATNPTLIVSDATSANAGSYTCVATNSVGSTTSSAASLTISSTQNLGRLVNISCRAGVGTGANILIVGFVSGGSATTGTQPVLIRANLGLRSPPSECLERFLTPLSRFTRVRPS